MNNTNLKDIKKYHDELFSASVTDKDKMSLSSLIALLTTTNYKKFETDYEKLILKDDKTPAESIVEIANERLNSLGIDASFTQKISRLWDTLKIKSSLNTVKPNETKCNLIKIVESFINDCYPHTQVNLANTRKDVGDFLGQLFAEINGHGANGKTGIVLTPYFLADFMTDLLELDYKTDVLLDGACGSGTFLVAAYTKMILAMEDDFNSGKITAEERKMYLDRINNSTIFGNDLNEEMAMLALMNFSLMGESIKNVSNEDFFKLDGTYFDTNKINKGILNPPFEYEPAHFALHMIERIVSNSNTNSGCKKKFVIICPPQSMGKSSDKYLTKILNIATLDAVIEVQGNAFQESNISFGTSIFVFDLSKAHKASDKVLYYDFTNSGYEYFKDSGLVDKYNKFDTNKKAAISNIKNRGQYTHKNNRTWTTFFDIPESINFEICIDPMKIKMKDVEETDLTKANQEIKTILKEKQELIDSVGNKIPNSEEFENYIVDLLSEVGE